MAEGVDEYLDKVLKSADDDAVFDM